MSDGVLDIVFSKVVSDAIVGAIEVVPANLGAPLVAYQYRGDGLRHSKSVNGLTTTYTWDVNSGLPAVLQDDAYTYVYGLGLLSQTDGSSNQQYFLGDGLGSTRALTDGSGAVVATYAYDAFGEVRSATGTANSEYRFTGQQDDATLGYQYLRARYYDPQTGRFISKDPFPGSLSSPSSQHKYGYASNTPTNLTDPTGQTPWNLVGAFAGGLLGAGTYAVTHWDQVSQGNIDWGEASRYTVGGALLFSGVGAIAELAGGGGAVIGIGGAAQIGAGSLGSCSGRQAGIASVADILRNPNLLRGKAPGSIKAPGDIAGVIEKARDAGWRIETLGQGTHEGQGLMIREVINGKTTGRIIQWHPGGGHHGPAPYWKVSSPELGTVRIGPQFPQ